MNKIYKFIILGLLVFLPRAVSAHAFGQLYNLPVPFWLYLYGAATAVILSFTVIGYFIQKTEQNHSYRLISFSNLNKWFVETLKFISVFLFALTILTGILGQNNAFSNFNMTFFWIIIALGLTYLTAVIGNVYAFINPWKVLTEWIGLGSFKGMMNYPKFLGYFPAFVFYYLFIWLELVGQTTPYKLSIVLILYTIANAFSVILFGSRSWFQYGEFFSVFFRLIGKIAPIEYKSGRLYLRAPFVGLLKDTADHFSLLIFTLFMLSSTAYDGFRETLPWVRLYWWNLDQYFRPIFGQSSYAVFESLGLLLSPLLFLVIYLVLVWIAKAITKSEMSLKSLMLQFAFTLIPIALVYNIAHYFTLIFTEAPNIIRLASDPFGFGWNIFGTTEYFGRYILKANFVWHSQVAFILLGHIVAVYLAHMVSLRIFSSHKKALLSQIPMLVLMVLYTMIGLWILSQPITGGTF